MNNIATSSDPAAVQHRSTKAVLKIDERILLFMAAVVYGVLLCLSYIRLSHFWGYFGFTYTLYNPVVAFATCVAAALPILLAPKVIRQSSTFNAAIIYIVVFMPCLIVPILQQSGSFGRSMQIFGVVFVSAVAFIAICNIKVRPLTAPKIPARLFWSGFSIVYLGLLGYVLISMAGSLSLVGLDQIYVQRFAAADAIGAAGRFTGYAIMFLSYALNPFLIACGLETRRWILVVAGAVGQVIMFSTLASRSTFISPLLIVGVWYLFKSSNSVKTLTVMLAFVLVAGILFPFMANYDTSHGVLDQLLVLVYLRTLLIAGGTFGVYVDFFSIYPHTHLTHSMVGKFFGAYPYGDLSVGVVVGLHLSPAFTNQMFEYNSNFLATDGVASFGLLGAPFAAVTLAFVLVCLAKITPPGRTRLAAAASVPFMLSLSNTSLFTSMLTGGGMLLYLTIFLSNDAVATAMRRAPQPRRSARLAPAVWPQLSRDAANREEAP